MITIRKLRSSATLPSRSGGITRRSARIGGAGGGGTHPRDPQPRRRGGEGVDGLQDHQQRPAWGPGAGEDLHPVDDEPDPQQGDEEPQQALDDLAGSYHEGSLVLGGG